MSTTSHTGRAQVRRLALVLCVLALAAVPALVPGLASAAAADPVDVAAGSLDWGVKAAFRSYVVGPIAHGAITPADGATTNADGTFHFPARGGGTYDQVGGALITAFDGTVRFTGHDGKLDFRISDVRVVFTGDAGSLVADVQSVPFDSTATTPPPPVVFDDVELAVLDPGAVAPVGSGATGISWTGVPALLTETGGIAFSEFYAAGTVLDPLTLALTLAEEVVVEPPVTVTAAVSASTVAVGAPMTVSGGGFVAGEQVEVWVLSDPVWVGTTTADPIGQVTFAFTVPAVAPGEHRAELRGVASARILASDPFTVTAVEVAGVTDTGTGNTTGTGGAGTGGTTVTGTLPTTGNETVAVLAVLGGLAVAIGLGLRRATRSTCRAGLTV